MNELGTWLNRTGQFGPANHQNRQRNLKINFMKAQA